MSARDSASVSSPVSRFRLPAPRRLGGSGPSAPRTRRRSFAAGRGRRPSSSSRRRRSRSSRSRSVPSGSRRKRGTGSARPSSGSSFSSAPRRGCPRAFVREEETGTAYALRKVAPGVADARGQDPLQLRPLPGDRRGHRARLRDPPGVADGIRSGRSRPCSSSAATASRSSPRSSRRSWPAPSQKNVLFVVISFPLLLPLLLSAIAATVAAAGGELPWTAAAGHHRLRRRRHLRAPTCWRPRRGKTEEEVLSGELRVADNA